jgi:hypothetical protein
VRTIGVSNSKGVDLRVSALCRAVTGQRKVPYGFRSGGRWRQPGNRGANLFSRPVHFTHLDPVGTKQPCDHGASRIDHDQVFDW